MSAGCAVLLKKPNMSKVSDDETKLWFCVACVSWTAQRIASSADLPFIPPEWSGGIMLCFAARYERWFP